MGVGVLLKERIKQARVQIRELLEKSEQVAERAKTEGQAVAKELRQVGERLKPVLSSVVSDSVAAVREWVDEVNQSLADMAVPSYRKARVAQKRLEEKFQQIGGAVAEKVRPGRKASVEEKVVEQTAESAPAPDAQAPVAESQVQQPRRAKAPKVAAATVKTASAKRGKAAGNGKAKKPAQNRQKPRGQIKTAGTGNGVSKAAKAASKIG